MRTATVKGKKYNAGTGVHPSEPNYVWAEAGSDFGVHTDADPAPANGNTFYSRSNHLTGQLNALGIAWKNYQEDVEFSTSPTNSVSGTASGANLFNGSSQISYAVKHNPMAFFADTDTENVFPLAQLFSDLSDGTVGVTIGLLPMSSMTLTARSKAGLDTWARISPGTRPPWRRGTISCR